MVVYYKYASIELENTVFALKYQLLATIRREIISFIISDVPP